MNHVLVIGATGRVGREVLAELPSAGVRVRGLVREPRTANLPPHVEVVRGDLTVPETLEQCLDGIDTVFLVWTASPDAVGPALERIVKHARRIVFLTSPHKTPHPFFQQPNRLRLLHTEIERLIETSGREWTFLRPGMFASNARLWWASRIRAGEDVVRWPYVGALTAPIHDSDIATVAVGALLEDGHAGAEYVITGPQSLTQEQQMLTIGEVIGRSVRLEEISPDEARRELSTVIPGFLLDAWGAAMGQPALMTSTVAEVTGKPARTFREWVTDHVAEFRT